MNPHATVFLPTSARSQYTYHPDKPLNAVDHEALIKFRDAIDLDPKTGGRNSLLKTWEDSTPPCGNSTHAGWEGVDCNCMKLYPLPPAPFECPDPGPTDENRVYRIDFGPRKPSNKRLAGTYSPYLGNLSECRQFYLHVNSFRGTIPKEFSKLKKMQRLLLRDNDLTGTLPPEISKMTGLKDLYFDRNELHGSIPKEWCDLLAPANGDSIMNVIQPESNKLLCGRIPDCLSKDGRPYLLEKHVEGTWLIHPDNPDSETSGFCDDAPPTCESPGCSVIGPKVVTSLDAFNVTFTPFQDNTGIARYTWQLMTVHEHGSEEVAISETTLNATESPYDPTTGVYTLQVKAKGLALTNGQRYRVKITAYDRGGPPNKADKSTGEILVDNTKPEARKVVFVAQNEAGCHATLQREIRGELKSASRSRVEPGQKRASLCWEKFVEEESSITSYEVCIADSSKSLSDCEFTKVGRNESFVVDDFKLQAGQAYFAAVRGVNIAGLSTIAQSKELVVKDMVEDDFPTWAFAIVVVVPAIFFILLFFRARSNIAKSYSLAQAKRTFLTERSKAMHRVIWGGKKSKHGWESSQTSEDPMTKTTANEYGRFLSLSEVTFVFTDLMESTTVANAESEGYRLMQELHDRIIRQCIEVFDGYEINTQGDSFEIAFPDPFDALQFCTRVQRELLAVKWPAAVMELAACSFELDENGVRRFNGPRVRMAVHHAKKTEFHSNLHDLSKHLVFDGAGFKYARTLCDAANGGQILASHEFVVKTRYGLAKCDREPSSFQYISDFSPVSADALSCAAGYSRSLYQVNPGPGNLMPRRTFLPHLSGFSIARNHPGGFNVCDPSEILEQSTLSHHPPAVVTVRMPYLPKTASVSEFRRELRDFISIHAQVFGGYVDDSSHDEADYDLQRNDDAFDGSAAGGISVKEIDIESKGRSSNGGEGGKDFVVLLLFPSAARAASFANTLHMGLLYADWELMGLEAALVDSAVERGIDGRLKYRGPCAAIVVDVPCESGAAIEFVYDAKPNAGVRNFPRLGCGVSMGAMALSTAALEGQTVLTKKAWGACHVNLPVESHVLHLGGFHLLGRDEELFQVMPMPLCERQFPLLEVGEQVRPGYNDSPAVVDENGRRKGVAICFAIISALNEDVDDATRAAGLLTWQKICRETLQEHGGYECKEPDPGKFTLAFPDVFAAATFCVEAQERLTASMPSEMKVAMGVAYGFEVFRKPLLATGRADYFGALPNLAARVMGQARPGQALVEMTNDTAALATPGRLATVSPRVDGGGRLRIVDDADVDANGERSARRYALEASSTTAQKKGRIASTSAVSLREVGYCGLKGIDTPLLLLEMGRLDAEAQDGMSKSSASHPHPKGFISFSRAEAEEYHREQMQAGTPQRSKSARAFSTKDLRLIGRSSKRSNRMSSPSEGMYAAAQGAIKAVFSAKFSNDPFDVLDVQVHGRNVSRTSLMSSSSATSSVSGLFSTPVSTPSSRNRG